MYIDGLNLQTVEQWRCGLHRNNNSVEITSNDKHVGHVNFRQRIVQEIFYSLIPVGQCKSILVVEIFYFW